MNSDYESEELLSLDESSSSSEHGNDSSDDDIPIAEVDNSIRRSKTSRVREKAQDAVDGVHTAQFNQLWEYCDELRRCSLGSTVLIKVHTYNDGDLANEHALATGLQYFLRIYICLDGCKKDFLFKCMRQYPMTRFQANRQMIIKVEFELCPKIRKRLYKEKLACSKWEDAKNYVNTCYKRTTYIDCYDPIIEPIDGQNTWGPSGLPPVLPLIKKRPPSRPKKKMTLEPSELRSHSKNRRSCKGEVGGNSSLLGSASQVSRTIRRATKDGHANNPATDNAQPRSNAQPTVHRAQPSSNDDVTTSAPPPPQ
ncbi:uncharacterized protein LOC142643904 [Castanea sativa]|uniref:uncharacterized protein LOC142643904 n=1 Tax=Castanea sativa TaxID=21020 RepID=UPI003F64E585